PEQKPQTASSIRPSQRRRFTSMTISSSFGSGVFLIIFSSHPHKSLHCHSYSRSRTEQGRAMHVQIVNFNLKDMTDAGFRSMANEVAPAFASVPGLLGKIWLADVGKNT